jgi:hypothetical protein
VLYNHHHCLKNFSSPQTGIVSNCPFSPILGQPVFSDSMNEPPLDISFKRNSTIFFLFYLAFFTQHVLKVCPCCSMCQNLIPSCGWVIFMHINIPPIFYLSADGHSGCFYFSVFVNNAAMNIGIQIPN